MERKTQELEQLFLEAYDANADDIFRHCVFRLRDREKAKEVTQEVFTRTWEYLRSGHDIDNMRAFLYRVANNLIIDTVRVKGRTTSLDEFLEQGIQIPEDKEKGKDPFFAAEARQLVTLVDKLDDMYREVIVMRYLEDLSVKEIAHHLGETESNVSVRIHRGIAKLRELFNGPVHE